jgi:hypothetical protein
MTEQPVDNLRTARKASRASRRALGADAVEETAVVKTIRRKAPAADAVVVETAKVNPRKPTPENPQYTRSGYAAKDGQQLYEATGSSGQIAVRSSVGVMVCGIDVADVAAASDVARGGQVWALFSTEKAAEKKAAQLREQGLTVNIVAARPYAGQPGDPA